MASYDDDIAESVAKHGWDAIVVNDCEPPFAYSVGLMTTFDHPELIVFGMERKAAHAVLSTIVDNIRRGKSFSEPGNYDGVLNVRIAIRKVHPTQHEFYLGFAMGHCTNTGNIGGLMAVQVFWPDYRGRFPFEPRCSEEVFQAQSRLDLPVSKAELEKFRRQFGP